MSEYREPPAPKPVVIVTQGRVTVVDPRKGSLIWSRAVGKPVNRLFVVDDRLFICVPDWVYCFQLDSGQHLGGVALPFEAKAGVVDAGHLILAGDYASLTASGTFRIAVLAFRSTRRSQPPLSDRHRPPKLGTAHTGTRTRKEEGPSLRPPGPRKKLSAPLSISRNRFSACPNDPV